MAAIGERRAGMRPAGGGGSQRRPKPAVRRSGAALLPIPAFCVLLAGLVFLGRLPGMVALAYAGASAFTFCLYAWDKSAAKRGAWRTPESTLHLWALLGGWPGALLAQQLLRHKSVKAEFRGVFWVTVLLNVAALVWLASSGGRGWLAALA